MFHAQAVVVPLFDLSYKKRTLEDRGALPREEEDLIRDYKTMHVEIFLSSLAEGGGHRGQGRRNGENEQGSQRRRVYKWKEGALEGGKDRVAVVCAHICCYSLPA